MKVPVNRLIKRILEDLKKLQTFHEVALVTVKCVTLTRGVGSIKRLGGTGFEEHFWNEGGGGGGEREGKINAIIKAKGTLPLGRGPFRVF